MKKIHEIVRDVLFAEEEALSALACGYMNLSAYAKRVHAEVEGKAKKAVKPAGIVVALSRLQKELGHVHPLVKDIQINNITTKSPLSELVFEKTPRLLARFSSMHEEVKTKSDDFLTMTVSTSELTVICSDRIKPAVLKHLKDKPRMNESGLACIGLSLDPKYYHLPNITFSLLRRIAKKHISLAETITTHTEIIFVFHQRDLPEILKLFSAVEG